MLWISWLSLRKSGVQVPRSKSVKPHPVSGLARINLTFRRLDPQSAARAPSCKCGQKAVLKVPNSPLHATCLQAHLYGHMWRNSGWQGVASGVASSVKGGTGCPSILPTCSITVSITLMSVSGPTVHCLTICHERGGCLKVSLQAPLFRALWAGQDAC